ncbi:MAG: hypothetical protein JRJ21_11225 [Deltaproteobacteria bacterium]|nr:hypothetical protein [Deltaproteobacteria bacterium]
MENYIKASILDNEDEGRLIDSILTERGIPHRMRSYYDTAFDGLYQTQKGWGYVSAPASYEEEIIEIISDLRKAADRL